MLQTLADIQLLQGNHYCSRDYGSGTNSNSYHYSNSYAPTCLPCRYWQLIVSSNGSYYYSNSNGSTYYNNGQGNSTYTPPGGESGGKK
jgi:hypothetical protein